jgi:hypothetical protein
MHKPYSHASPKDMSQPWKPYNYLTYTVQTVMSQSCRPHSYLSYTVLHARSCRHNNDPCRFYSYFGMHMQSCRSYSHVTDMHVLPRHVTVKQALPRLVTVMQALQLLACTVMHALKLIWHTKGSLWFIVCHSNHRQYLTFFRYPKKRGRIVIRKANEHQIWF